MSQTTSLAALVVIGSKASDGSGLFAGDAADLGHAHQNGDRGSQADTVDAGDQVEPSREITMLANGGDQLLELGLQKPLDPVDLLLPELADSLVPACLTAGLWLGRTPPELLAPRHTLGPPAQTPLPSFLCFLRSAPALA